MEAPAPTLTLARPAIPWGDVVKAALAGTMLAAVLVLLLTEDAWQSEWVRHEIQAFARHDRLIVPVRISDCPVPEVLAQYQIIRWDGNASSSEGLKEIYRMIMGGLLGPRPIH